MLFKYKMFIIFFFVRILLKIDYKMTSKNKCNKRKFNGIVQETHEQH